MDLLGRLLDCSANRFQFDKPHIGDITLLNLTLNKKV